MAQTRTARFIISAVDRTRDTIRRITGNVNGLGSSFQRMGRLVGPAIAGLATGAAVKGFASMIQRANDLTDSLRDTSIRLGIGVSDLQAYQLAAGNAGIEADQLTGIIGKLNKAAGEIKLGQGSDKTIAAFDSIGISVAEIQASRPAELFEKVVDGLGEIEDPATRAALAMQIVGKSGQLALTLIADGSGVLRESKKLLEDYGLSLSEIDANNVDAANDALGTLGKLSDFAKQKVGAELAPVIAKFGNDMLEAGKKGEKFGTQIEDGVGKAVEVFSRVSEAAFFVGNSISAAFNVIQGIFSNIGAAVLGFVSDFTVAIGTTAPKAFNELLAATESGLTKMKQGFSDFATAAANVIVAGMNKGITAIDTLVNAAAAGISKFIDLANTIPGIALPTFSYSQTSPQATFFDRDPDVDPVRLGRIEQFGQGFAGAAGELSTFYGRSASEQFLDAGTDVRQAAESLGDLFSAEGGTINKAFLEATEYANKLTKAVDPPSGGGGGGGSGGGGGATGAMKNLGEEAKKAKEVVVDSFNQMGEIGTAAFSGIERAIDEVTKTGKLDFSEMARSILSDIAAILAKSAILGGILGSSQYGGDGSGLVGSTIAGFFSKGSVPSASGGGFTGFGSRSGGIDGKGGFPAILHPNETVLDHTKGQSMGGGTINQTVIIRETMAAGQARGIVNAAVEASKAAFAQINARGGSRRKAYGLG